MNLACIKKSIKYYIHINFFFDYMLNIVYKNILIKVQRKNKPTYRFVVVINDFTIILNNIL